MMPLLHCLATGYNTAVAVPFQFSLSLFQARQPPNLGAAALGIKDEELSICV